MIQAADYELLREAAGLVDRSARGKLRLTGAEAAEFLQGQVTNDVEALEPGRGCYAALLNHKGKLRADMRVLRGEDWIWLDTEPGAQALLDRTVRTFGIGRDVRGEDVTDAEAILSLVGPAARRALDAEPAGRGAFVRPRGARPVRGHRRRRGRDLPGGRRGGGAAGAWRRARVRGGRRVPAHRVRPPRFGLDFDGDTIPEEAGLNERAVSFTKGCYVGQETVARLHYKGKPNRHLRGLRSSEPVAPGQALRLGERQVGAVGSATVSPAYGPIALAVVRREAAPGDTLDVGDSGATAKLVELPFG